MREERIEGAVAAVLAVMGMTEQDAAYLDTEIQAWLQKRSEKAASNTHAMQLKQVEQRLEKLTDALIDRLIDSDTFNNRKQALLL